MSAVLLSRLHKPPRSPDSSRRFHWSWVVLALAVAAAIVTWMVRPRATIRPASTALAQFQLGWQSRIVRWVVRGPHGVVATILKRGQNLWPVHALNPGIPLRIAAVVAGPTWDPFFGDTTVQARLVTPLDPRLAIRQEQVAPGQRVTVRLSAPSWGLVARRLGSTAPIHLSGTSATWAVGARVPRPGEFGAIGIQTRARVWEKPTSLQILRWSSTPWLQVKWVGHTHPLPDSLITIRFSAPILRLTANDLVLTPSVNGQWRQAGPDTWIFKPSGQGWWPGQPVTLAIAGGRHGVVARNGSYLASTTRLSWTVASGDVLRAQELLAKLDYLPLVWTRSGASVPALDSAQVDAIYNPPGGSFQWRYANVPASLAAFWQPGQDTVMVTGAVMAFEHQHGLPVNGILGPEVWKALVNATLAGQDNISGYTYVYVSETEPEQLTVWHDGQLVLTSLANTGIAASPTYLGTFPVYQRYTSQTMSGVNPDGVPYDDPGVPWVNYFKGGDAVHGFPRARYGFPQSLGCVELPITNAAIAWRYIHYGTLVTVEPPGSPRSL